VLIAVPGFGDDKAIGMLKAAAIEGGRTERYRVGNAARVLKRGRTIVELKPGRRKSADMLLAG
jgi:hypothetical protein